ncbi:hypothetical protein QIA34_07470 (plasmid) [Borreliella yangtzensis]|uniref:Uncharacterized protein with gpF-like domain n=1 Tax=Borreliella yangtzensis TaxID=683292 RepID=A0ABR6PBM3_9SPIR|nr:uncharacterized protein with gpF-like domain [Borreliella yangtzensis]
MISNINKNDFGTYDKKNLSQKNIYSKIENLKKEISLMKENFSENASFLGNKILNLETQIAYLESDINAIKKEFYKTKSFVHAIFHEYYLKSILILTIITPFITTIFGCIAWWIIDKFIK